MVKNDIEILHIKTPFNIYSFFATLQRYGLLLICVPAASWQAIFDAVVALPFETYFFLLPIAV